MHKRFSSIGPIHGVSSVLFVINSLGNGGAEKQVILLATALAGLGWTCNVVVFEQRQISEARQLLLHESRKTGVKYHLPPRQKLMGRAWLCRVISLIGLAGNRNVIWCWGAKAELLCKIACYFRRDLVLIVSLRSASTVVIEQRRRIHSWRTHSVQAYVSNSRKNIQQFRDAIPQAVATHAYTLNNIVSDQPCVSATRWNTYAKIHLLGNNRYHLKGYDVLMQVAARCLDEQVPVLFTIAGEDYDGNLQQAIMEHGVGTIVQHIGPIDDSIGYLREADMFLLTSRVEGMPNALLEAMSIGVPCISTDVGGVGEAFEDKLHLRICPIDDSDSLFQAIVQLLADYNAAKAMGRRGRDEVRAKFGNTVVASHAIAILEQVFQSKHSS